MLSWLISEHGEEMLPDLAIAAKLLTDTFDVRFSCARLWKRWVIAVRECSSQHGRNLHLNLFAMAHLRFFKGRLATKTLEHWRSEARRQVQQRQSPRIGSE